MPRENEWKTYTSYDWKSVMHYPAINSNSKKDGNGKSLNTMTSKVNILIIDFIDPEKYRLIQSNRQKTKAATEILLSWLLLLM